MGIYRSNSPSFYSSSVWIAEPEAWYTSMDMAVCMLVQLALEHIREFSMTCVLFHTLHSALVKRKLLIVKSAVSYAHLSYH